MDLVIKSVLIRGATAPQLINRALIKRIKKASVIDDGVVNYCMTNMLGAVARTSTYALTNATLPYILVLANKGVCLAISESYEIKTALNIIDGYITFKAVAEALGLESLAQSEG